MVLLSVMRRFLLSFLISIVIGSEEEFSEMQKNIYGDPLKICSTSPITGWYRDGYLNTDAMDTGSHTVCATMTAEFLTFTKSVGNDLSSPHPPAFPGLKPGDRWGLCAGRWFEAFQVIARLPVEENPRIKFSTSRG